MIGLQGSLRVKPVKFGRPPIRRFMTLVAAVRSDAGIAIAADAQETVGDCRRAVQKIQARTLGGVQFLIAGSGHADLIDSFILRMERVMLGADVSTLQEFVSLVETELYDFYLTDVAWCPDQDKSMRLVIGAAVEKTEECDVWVSKGIRIHSIGAYGLVGWDDTMYHGVIQRLVFPAISLAQATLAALYVIGTAKETSNYVGGDVSMALVLPKAIWPEPPEYVKEMETRLKDYEREVSPILLACADTGLSADELSERLGTFATAVSDLHLKHIKQVIRRDLLPREHAYAKVPMGIYYSAGHGDIIMMQTAINDTPLTQPEQLKPSASQKSEDQQ